MSVQALTVNMIGTCTASLIVTGATEFMVYVQTK